jgi:hypothetical protein
MKRKDLVWTAIGVALVVLAWLQVPSAGAQQPWCPSKYGPADVLGAINEITPEKVLQAVKLVKTGKVYDMGVLLERGVPGVRGRYWTQLIVRGVPFGGGARISWCRSRRSCQGRIRSVPSSTASATSRWITSSTIA